MLVSLLILILVVALIITVLNQLALTEPVRNVLYVALLIVVIIWLLTNFGVVGGTWPRR